MYMAETGERTTSPPRKNIVLTANIFYQLLLGSMKNKRLFSDNHKGNTNKLTEPHMFYDLNVLIETSKNKLGNFEVLHSGGKLQGSYKNAASKFKSGKFTSAKSMIYLFNDKEIVAEFDRQVKHNYSKALKKAIEFARRYFDTVKSSQNNTLVQKTIYLILHDDSIAESQEFYICSDGSTKTKFDLRNIVEIEFEPFLLGVWHYLIASQRLQSELQEILVDISYTQLSVKPIYSDVIVEVETEEEQETPDLQNSVDDSKSNCDDDKPTEMTGSTLYRNLNPDFAKRLKESMRHSISGYHEEPTPTICDSIKSFYPTEIDQNANIIAMLKTNNIALSRSIFFYLLEHSIQTVHPKRNKNAVEKLFLDLLNLTVDNSCQINFDRNFSRYCYNKFSYLKGVSSADCLDDESKINTFLTKFQTNYEEIIYDMIEISNKYFNSDTKNEALVVALIEFIRNDDSIDDNQEFYVCSDGSALTKAQLQKVEEIEFEAFLLGVWHYVVSLLNAKDSMDEYTFDTIFKISYEYNGKKCEIYRSGDMIVEQSELYVELIYLNE